MDLEDIIFRIEYLKSEKCLVYIMRDIQCYTSKSNLFYISLARYCNQPNLFKKMNYKQAIDILYKDVKKKEWLKELYKSA